MISKETDRKVKIPFPEPRSAMNSIEQERYGGTPRI
jgi:hypothetical protein